MLFFITGASGSGKSFCLPRLRARFPDMAWYEFDSGGVPPDADIAWRQRTLEGWMQRAREHAARGQDCGICGQVAYGEILAAPSAPPLDNLAVCLLDCLDPIVRIQRLRARGWGGDTQQMLNWAVWLRMHAADPTWKPDLIRPNGLSDYCWDRWETWPRGDPRWSVWMLDSTQLTLDETVACVARWVAERQSAARHTGPVSLSGEPSITIEDPPSEREQQFIEDQLNAYNVATTSVTDYRPLVALLRAADGALVGGLSGFTWGQCFKVTYLWVREDVRGQGYGSRLLAAAEREALARGCRQAVLETHSFQAPEFYERHGYVVAGTADDYPVSHRFHLLQKRLAP